MLRAVQKGHRFIELDSLRGLAAIAVVLGHFRGGLATPAPQSFSIASRLLGSGHAAVILFFLLSGFVLTVPYLGQTRPAYKAFAIKRVCRIWLPYVAAIAIAAAFAARLCSTISTGNPWIDQTWSRPFSGHLLVQHLLMIGHFDDVQWNTAIWSLIIEMRISLAFPVIAWCTARFTPIALLTLCVPGTVVLAYLARHSGHGMFFDTLFNSMIFLTGSLLSTHYDGLRAWLLACNPFQTIALLAIGIVLYGGGDSALLLRYLPATDTLAIYLSDWIVAAGAALVLMLSTTSGRLRHLLHARVVQWAGTRSYSIYLLHGTVLFTLIRLHRMQSLSLPILAFYIAITFTGAEIFHRLIERPALLIGRKLGSKTTPNLFPARRGAEPAAVPIRIARVRGDTVS